MIKPQKVLHLHLEEEKKKPNLNHDYMITEKKDGWFTYIDYIDGYWNFIKSSRQRTIPSLRQYQTAFTKIKPQFNCRIIAEAIIPDLDFHTMNGIFNRSVGDCHAKDVEFHIHDVVNLDNLSLSNLDRWNLVQEIGESKSIKKMKLLGVSNDKRIWQHYFDEITYSGGEGIILKQSDGVYCPDKRNSSLMKMKLENTFDLLCVSMYHTTGEKGNRNLNLKLRRKSGVEVDVRVGKHEDIRQFEENPESVLGKVVEVKAMKELENGQLREPRFMHVRNDKTESEID